MARQISHAGADTIVCGTAVVGSGAAGYSAALRLWQYGQRDILLLTENRMAGTSRNTGSDKQTYYKLTLSGDEPDSVGEMARTLFQGGCVDGGHRFVRSRPVRPGLPPAGGAGRALSPGPLRPVRGL